MAQLSTWLPRLMEGWWLTMALTVASATLAALIGLAAGLTLLGGPRLLRIPVRLYVDLVRGLPLLVLLFAVFYGSAVLRLGADVNAAVVVALAFFGGAHATEVVRSGFGSIGAGYVDAAKMLGLGRRKRFSLVILPLALPRMLPPSMNITAELLKGTSLASLIGAHELIHVTQSAVGSTFNPLLFYASSAVIYLVTILALSRGAYLMERRMSYSEY